MTIEIAGWNPAFVNMNQNGRIENAATISIMTTSTIPRGGILDVCSMAVIGVELRLYLGS